MNNLKLVTLTPNYADKYISLIKKDALSKTVFPDVAPLSQVSKSPCTEVYFWGIPSSGKSCALGAILSSAKSGKVARSMGKKIKEQGKRGRTLT